MNKTFTKYDKGLKMFVPYYAGVIFAQSILGEYEVPSYIPVSTLNNKLEYIFKNKLSHWFVQVR